MELTKDWLPLYTGMPLDRFGDYVLLTNFHNYLTNFADRFGFEIGHFILFIAAIRGDGTSDDYLPPMVPALSSFKLHKFVSEKLFERSFDYRTGVVYTTNRRVWEHDLSFKQQLCEVTAIVIDMETATVFVVRPCWFPTYR